MISVIVPVYNVEKYLCRCVDSILAQTFTDFELILIDDGSPDNCGAICDEYAERDKRVKVIHQKNQGVSAARNAGIEYSLNNEKIGWITFIDSDDWVHNDYLLNLFNAAKKLNTDMSICSYQKVEVEPENTEKKECCRLSNEDYWVNNRQYESVVWGKLYKKELFQNIRFPIGVRHEDEMILYKVLFSCENVAFDEAQLYYYYVNPVGFMQSKWNKERLAAIKALEDQLLFFRDRKELYHLTLKYYTNELYYVMQEMRANGYENISEFDDLQKKLKKSLIGNGRKLGFSAKKNKNMYMLAFPREMKVYEWFRKKKKHLKSLLKKKA